MNYKMSYNDQQRLKQTISERLKAAAQVTGQMAQPMNRQQETNPHSVQPDSDRHAHIMPDGMECMPKKAVTVRHHEGNTGLSRNHVLKNAFVLSELISEPACKKRHKSRRR